jgi:ribosomal protein L33
MAKKKNPTEVFHMVCKDCGAHNYVVKLKRIHKGLSLKKYCPKTRTKTEHTAKKP